MSPFLRHIAACDDAILPGDRIPLLIGNRPIGFVDPGLAPALADFDAVRRTPRGLTLNDADAADLHPIAKTLAEAGFMRWRNEAFDVRAHPDGPALATIDRGALPAFGIQAQGIHLDALVARPEGPHIWIARRAADKALDPGKFDHLVAGGIPAGFTAHETLLKEAMEEAALPPDLAARAVPCGRLGYAMLRPEGLRRDLLHCYEVTLPDDFTPTPTDGEVAGFELWPLQRAFEAVRDTDGFKFNVNLVLMKLFVRHGLLAPVPALDQLQGR